jgi:hypothetical protein
MTPIQLLTTLLDKTIDPRYTIESVTPVSVTRIEIAGFYNPEDGMIWDNLLLTLRPWFYVKTVWSGVQADAEGYLPYNCLVQRRRDFSGGEV